jgi:hypothetical protein
VNEFDVFDAIREIDSSVVASWDRAAIRLLAGVHSNVIRQSSRAFEFPVAQMTLVLENRICFVNQHVLFQAIGGFETFVAHLTDDVPGFDVRKHVPLQTGREMKVLDRQFRERISC